MRNNRSAGWPFKKCDLMISPISASVGFGYFAAPDRLGIDQHDGSVCSVTHASSLVYAGHRRPSWRELVPTKIR
jgi:hypothetical protein